MVGEAIAWGISAVLLVGLLLGFCFLLRARRLLNLPASIQVAFRGEDGRWVNGIAVLGDETLDLYPTRSLRWAPSRRARRDGIQFELRPEREGVQIATLATEKGKWHIASSAEEVSAMLSWIDSAPPEAEPTIA